jgi:hypothetical protein
MIDPVDGVKATDLNIPGKYKRLFNGMDLNDNVLINIDKDDTANGKILNNSYHACSPYFDTVFCHIATETLFMDDTLHLTEKSLRAFVSKRPMLLLGPPHSLSYLRSYGFKTWGDFWDESYDEIRDPWQRMEAVIKIVEKLNSLSLDEMEDMLDAMNHINEHNFRHFFLDFPEKLIRELMDNMHVAVNAAKSRPPNGWMIKRINEVTDEHFKKIISADITDEFSNKELYDDYLMNDKTKIDHNLARVLLLELGFDKESSKEEILARLKIILD